MQENIEFTTCFIFKEFQLESYNLSRTAIEIIKKNCKVKKLVMKKVVLVKENGQN